MPARWPRPTRRRGSPPPRWALELVEGCCAELLDEQYRTARRRLLSDAAAGDPGIGLGGTSVSQRSEPLLRAIGADPRQYGRMDLGTPRYLTGPRRARILAHRDRDRDRDRYRAMAG
ncbi:hypothetical protein [Pseudonocardia sp. H11422]|uniref:hypothetical protein n=1 Tax=Pseudonocardia sp. H11422 TaxID=2835866 RepID=UPI001BDC63B1|nr:hypothetical protein [Pseudonocardia sp. H11422]